MLHAVFQHGGLRLEPRGLLFEGGVLGAQALDGNVYFADLFGGAVDLVGKALQLAADVVVLRAGDIEPVRLLADHRGGTVQHAQPHADLQLLAFGGQQQELLRLDALLFERADAGFELCHDISEADEVFFGLSKALVGVRAAVTVMGDTGGFLKHFAPVLALGAHELVHLALADHGVAVAPEAGIHKKLVHVFEACGLAIDEIAAVAGAVVAAGNADLLFGGGQRAVGIIQPQRDLSEALRAAGGGAGEDHVFHFGSAQLFRALFAQHPANGVRDVGLAAAVGPDDAGDAVLEREHGFIGEGLEALNFQSL